jgi:ribosomal protein S18 acetylase RimI-like enzyme
MVAAEEPSLEPSLPNSVDHVLITELEARTFSAWSPLHQAQFGGWRLGCAQGYTRRANSVYPLSWESGDDTTLHDQIDACERWYSDHRQPICFKLTAASQPSAITSILDARGYAAASGALVMSADLSGWRANDVDESSSAQLTPIANAPARVSIVREFSEQWLEILCSMNAAQAPHRAIIRQMLSNNNAERYFATVYESQNPAAVGLAVRDGTYIGLFDIVTGEAARRRGHARRLVRSLLDAGVMAGAQTAYLQVVERNAPALSLYSGLGFRPMYRYWYRQKP